MPIKVTTDATVLPFDATASLRYLRALQDDQARVNLCVRAATDAVEDYTGLSLITRTLVQQMQEWPLTAQARWNAPHVRSTLPLVRYMEFERNPVSSVTSLKYYPEDGSAQTTISSSNYRLDTTSVPAKLTLIDDYALPSLALRFDAIELTFTAGYGLTEAVLPGRAVMAVVMLARHFYDNPTVIDATGKVIVMPLAFDHLLKSLRV